MGACEVDDPRSRQLSPIRPCIGLNSTALCADEALLERANRSLVAKARKADKPRMVARPCAKSLALAISV